MTKVARYIIVLDRMDDDEFHWVEDGYGPQDGMNQVAAELQEAMNQTGEPAGFFRVVARTEIDYDKLLAFETDNETAHRGAMQVLDDTRSY